ncbi:MAG: hypothetical protein GTO41_26120 [Burkholderiales bacterium]|nr:hypothetical protein [Burkholderiales bacterium]
MEHKASTWTLSPHPLQTIRLLDGIEVDAVPGEFGQCRFRFRAHGDITRLRVPAPRQQSRAPGLWKHTCFEVFLKPPGGGYYELNFSPSSQWAAYHFNGYRQGIAELALAVPPLVDCVSAADRLIVDVTIDLSGVVKTGVQAWPRMGLAAVIESDDGEISYWALAHPTSKPDFHHPDSFVGALADNVA